MTVRIASGTTDQYAYFNSGGITGLSSFTVYRARNGAAAAAMTTPTVAEVDATNMPGEYSLLLDEDMTIGASNVTEAMVFFITAAGMASKRIEVELFDPAAYSVDIGSVNGTTVTGSGTAMDPWGP